MSLLLRAGDSSSFSVIALDWTLESCWTEPVAWAMELTCCGPWLCPQRFQRKGVHLSSDVTV